MANSRIPLGQDYGHLKKLLLILNIIICVSSIIYVIHFFQQQSFNDIATELQKVKGNYLFILSVTFCSNVIGTIALMVSFNQKIPIKKFFLFHAIDLAGDAVSRVTPTNIVVGDSYKALTFSNFGFGKTESTSALILFRIYCLLSNFSFFFICLILYIVLRKSSNFHRFDEVIVIIAGVFLLGVAALFILKKNNHVWKLHRKTRVLIHRNQKLEWVYKKARGVYLTIRSSFYEHKSKFFILLLLTTIQKFGGVLELYFLLGSLGIQTTLYNCMIFEMGIIIMRLVFAAIPMQLGVEEVWNKVLLDIIHIDSPQTCLTVSIIRRFRMFVWILYGFIFLVLLNLHRYIREKRKM